MTTLTARHPILDTLSTTLETNGKWLAWCQSDPRLQGHDSLQSALTQWREHRSERAYLTVAALASIGSSRGGNDDDAAMSVAFMLQDGIVRVAADLRDRCQLDDVLAAMWEEVKRSAPNLGHRAPLFLLRRAKARALGAGEGYMANRDGVRWSALDVQDPNLDVQLARAGAAGAIACGGTGTSESGAVDAASDLRDVLVWARATGVLAQPEVDLVVELVRTTHIIAGRDDVYRVLGQRHGVADRTIRRRRNAVVGRLRAATGDYLAAVS